MSPDLLFLAGVLFLGLTFPATLAAFSSSDGSFRAPFLMLVAGAALVVAAVALSPSGYAMSDVPRIALDLVR